MTRIYALAGFLVGLSSPCLAADAPPTFASLFGTWKVDRMVGASPITADQKASEAPLGTMVTISPELITTFEKSGTCKPRNPTVTEVDTEAKLDSDFGTKRTGLYLPEGSLKPRLPFLDAGCAFALVINQNTLLWPMGNGYIYTATRQPAFDAR